MKEIKIAKVLSGSLWKIQKIPLDIVFIDDNFEVLQVSKGQPLAKEPIYGKGNYVLEVNPDSGNNCRGMN